MKVVVIYKDQTDYSRVVIDFLHDFEKQTGHVLETIDPDTPEGTLFCEAYGVVEYPSVIAISDGSVMQNSWSGVPLPTISEVSYYVQ